MCDRQTDTQTDRQTLRIAFHHLESFPRMKYNNQIITKRYLSELKKPKNQKQLYFKTSKDRRTSQTDRHTDKVIHRGAPLLNTLRIYYFTGPGADTGFFQGGGPKDQ